MSPDKKQRVCLTRGQEKDTKVELKQTYNLDTLPPEVLEMILRFLPFQDVASLVRLVSRRCAVVATSVLNSAFLAAGTKFEIAMNHIETTMLQAKTDTDLLMYSKAYNTLELIRSQYKMLKAVTWRYTHPPRQERFFRLCFYAGSLLDNLYNFLWKAKVQPSALNGIQSTEPNVVTFIGLCKRFMNFFEKISERKVNKSASISGCKTVDVLDCLAEGRQVLSFRVSSNRGKRKTSIVSMRLRYVMRRTWFTCLEVPNIANENSWRDEQRFMYLRLRRLVGSVNEHLYEKLHYERELLLERFSRTSILRPPPASTYSGYGEYGGQFFYYGNMNKYAYENKIQFVDTIELGDPEDEDTEEDEIQETLYNGNDLVVIIDLRCSPELAPLAVRSALKSDHLETISSSMEYQPELYLKLTITCPASMANRLPGTFTWELRTPRRARNLT